MSLKNKVWIFFWTEVAAGSSLPFPGHDRSGRQDTSPISRHLYQHMCKLSSPSSLVDNANVANVYRDSTYHIK